MQHDRQRHDVDWNHHKRESADEAIRCVDRKQLEPRGRAQEAGPERNDQITDPKPTPECDR